MNEIHAANDVQAVAMLCPQCSSPALTRQNSHLLLEDPLDAAATCGGCGWNGKEKDLVALPFRHELGSDEGIAIALMNDMRAVIAGHLSGPVGKFLMKWGFLSSPLSTAEFSRYMSAIARSVLTTIIQEREKIEKEKANG